MKSYLVMLLLLISIKIMSQNLITGNIENVPQKIPLLARITFTNSANETEFFQTFSNSTTGDYSISIPNGNYIRKVEATNHFLYTDTKDISSSIQMDFQMIADIGNTSSYHPNILNVVKTLTATLDGFPDPEIERWNDSQVPIPLFANRTAIPSALEPYLNSALSDIFTESNGKVQYGEVSANPEEGIAFEYKTGAEMPAPGSGYTRYDSYFSDGSPKHITIFVSTDVVESQYNGIFRKELMRAMPAFAYSQDPNFILSFSPNTSVLHPDEGKALQIMYTLDHNIDMRGYKETIVTENFEQFTEVSSISFPGVFYGSIDWGDYDNDGDLDILLTGKNSDFIPISKIFQNNNGTFSEVYVGSLIGVSNSFAEWGDFDNDGNLDILLAGDDGSNPITKIYRNTGNGFSEVFSENLTNIKQASGAWGDYDNDGALDILLTGIDWDSGDPVSKIYENIETGFMEKFQGDLTGVAWGTTAWGDYDNDGDLDLMLAGFNSFVPSTTSRVSKIFQNKESSFNEVFSGSLIGVAQSSLEWGDYDNDGDLDILLTGGAYDQELNVISISKIYENTGSGFNEVFIGELSNVVQGAGTWGDYDNDGDLDILLSGMDINNGTPITKVYNNNSNGFNEISADNLNGVSGSSIKWGDYDNDGDLDFLLSGTGNGTITKLYRNNNFVENNLPSTPQNLSSIVNSQNVVLSWDKITDIETPQNGLTYNLCIGTTQGGTDVLSPMADRNTGYRRIVKMGNTNMNNSWVIKGLAPGTYYWSVQAIDNCFAGSPFAEEQTFIIGELPNVVFLNSKIFLEGNYSNGSMSTNLNTNDQIPLSQPFANYSRIESVTSIPSNVVDWVLVELRTNTNKDSWVAKRAGFLRNDGFIMDLDGVNALKFENIDPGLYYIVVYHRNHLPVMSREAYEILDQSCPGVSSIEYGGKTYHTVQIGDQCWLRENLDIGNMIQGSEEQTDNSTIEKYCYDNNPTNCEIYGGLYQWNEAMQYVTTEGAKGICPDGWHIPTLTEFETLSTTVGGDGNALKAIGQGTGDGVGTNTSGFSVLLSGSRLEEGNIDFLGYLAYFWSSLPNHVLYLQSNISDLNTFGISNNAGVCIRCIKD